MAPRTWQVDREQELLPHLLDRLSDLKRGDVKRLLRFGSVSVNGRPVTRHDKPLRPGDEVTVDRGAKSAPGAGRGPAAEIVFEDDDLIVVDKPAGLLTVATGTEKERTVHRAMNDYFRLRGARHGARLHVVHRLDRETSGLLIFAKSDGVRKALQEHWEDVEKRYYAVVEGLPRREEGRIESRLAQDKSLRVRSVAPDAEGKDAVTHYRVIRKGPRRTLLDVRLETGRKNQIRVHLADINHPVVGDAKYGHKTGPGGRMALHAWRLAFSHPRTGEPLVFETPLPKSFERMLEQ